MKEVAGYKRDPCICCESFVNRHLKLFVLQRGNRYHDHVGTALTNQLPRHWTMQHGGENVDSRSLARKLYFQLSRYCRL